VRLGTITTEETEHENYLFRHGHYGRAGSAWSAPRCSAHFVMKRVNPMLKIFSFIGGSIAFAFAIISILILFGLLAEINYFYFQ